MKCCYRGRACLCASVPNSLHGRAAQTKWSHNYRPNIHKYLWADPIYLLPQGHSSTPQSFYHQERSVSTQDIIYPAIHICNLENGLTTLSSTNWWMMRQVEVPFLHHPSFCVSAWREGPHLAQSMIVGSQMLIGAPSGSEGHRSEAREVNKSTYIRYNIRSV